jgi:hypothetical protein
MIFGRYIEGPGAQAAPPPAPAPVPVAAPPAQNSGVVSAGAARAQQNAK